MRIAAILALTLIGAGCNPQPNAEKRQSDAQDVARVEAAQDTMPPIAAFKPQPIAYADIEEAKLFGASCTFLPENAAQGGIIVLAMAKAAYVKIEDNLHVYAADSGSEPLPLGNWSRYEGREHVIDLQIADGEGTPSGDETTDWPGRLTIRDPYDRVVYAAPGTVQCGA